jgi:tetratricopeptide (TPR) repeat protein
VQKTSLSHKRDQWHISIAYGLLLAILSLLGGASASYSEEASAVKPRRKGYDPEAVKHYNRGLELQQAGFLNKAVEEYRNAIKADDRLEQAYSNLGLIYLAQKNYSRAQEAFDRALAIKPSRPNSLNGLASVLYAQHLVPQAIDQWRKVIHFNPRFASAYFNMGIALESQKNDIEALDAYVKAVEIAPDMADAYYHMGILMFRLKHPAQALVLLEQAIALAPESEFARTARKHILNIKETFAKETGDTTAEAPRVIHSASPRENEKDNTRGKSANSSNNYNNNQGLATKNASDTSTGQTPAQTGTKEDGSTTAAAGTDNKTSAGATDGATAEGGATTNNTAAATDSTSNRKKKRKPLFKRTNKPLNDEEKQAQSNPQPEMKMFVKPPEQDSDLQAKP